METLHYDYLVLGSGIAGLTFALHAAKAGKVAVACKGVLADTGTTHAQGGIAAVLSSIDSFELHVQDTLEAGAGLCNEEAVRFMVAQAPEAIQWLQQLGLRFDRADNGELALGLEGGHHEHRIAHVKDHTGLSIQQVLSKVALQEPNISILDYHMGLELLVEEERCHGMQLLDLRTKESKVILAGAVVLATGGSGQVYRHTTNPGLATGDGLAMAYRAGVKIKHMEFFQFHPTALYDPTSQDTFLISEALRGAGAELVLPDGSRFMYQYHQLGSLAPRDVVSRAVYREMKLHNSPCLYLDARHFTKEYLQKLFPFIYARCKSRGMRAERDLIPVVPAAHYQCGGIETDLHGETSLIGLYAIGEVACTGVHGANRLASNSLLEGLVFAKSAAKHLVAKQPRKLRFRKYLLYPEEVGFTNDLFTTAVESVRRQLQQVMWDYVGIVRTKQELVQAHRQIATLTDELTIFTSLFNSQKTKELQNLLTVADMIVKAALIRKRSIGGHFVEEEEMACQV